MMSIDWDAPIKRLRSMIRPHQLDVVRQASAAFAEGHTRVLVPAPTGFGKSLIATMIALYKAKQGDIASIGADRRSLINQLSGSLYAHDIEHGVLMAGAGNWRPDARILVCSLQTLEACGAFPDCDLFIYDECFPGDVEILTDKGFKRFDSIDEQTRVAQCGIPDLIIDFRKPTKVIRKHYEGDLVRIQCPKLLNIRMTPNHELVIRDINHGSGSYRKIAAGEATLNVFKRLPVAGIGVGETRGLTPRERLLIAAQADGSIHWEGLDGTATLAFSFSKERKIKRFLEIVEAAGVEWAEVAGKSSDRANVLPRRRFMVRRMPLNSKHIYQQFTLDLMGCDLAAAIIEEMVCWDGHLHSESSYYFSSTDKDAADFYQAVAVLAGYKTNLTIQVDDRKESFSPVHRLFIQKNCNEISGQALSKTIEPFSGELFCVRVPAGNIVVRSGGKVLIVGNCHVLRKRVVEWMMSRPNMRVLGLTATPLSKGLGSIYQAIVPAISTNALIEHGYLIRPTIYVAKTIDMKGAKKVAGEWSDREVEKRGKEIVGDIPAEWEAKTRLHCGGPAKTIAFVPTVDFAHLLAGKFQALGYNFVVVSYKEGKDEQEEIIKEFRRPSSSIIGLISVDVFTRGFDVADVQVLIDARPLSKSLTTHIQKIGRLLRTSPGKTTENTLLLDHAGNWLRFAEDTERIFEEGFKRLDDGATEAKQRATDPSEKTLSEFKCECGYILPPKAPACPSCGRARVRRSLAQVVPGSMILINGRQVPAAGKHAYLSNPGEVWQQLVHIAKQKKPGDQEWGRRWAQAKYNALYGEFSRQKFEFTEPKAPSAELIGKIKAEQIRWARRRQAA